MSLLRLEFSTQSAVRKFSLNHAALLLSVLLFAIALVPQPVHAVGATTCSTTADFHLEPIPDQFKVPPGASGTSTILATPINGFSGTVTLSTVNVPPEITVTSLSPKTLNLATGTETATLTFSASSTPGDYSFNIQATITGTLYQTHGIWVKILGPEIGISADKPTISIPQGESDTATISLRSLYGFAGSVDLTTEVHGFGLFHVYTPPTASLSASPVTLTSTGPGTSGTSTLTISTSGVATPGLYAIVVAATSTNPTATNSTRIYVEVHGPDFAIGLKASTLNLPLGTSKTVPFYVNSTMSFAGQVALRVPIPSYFGTSPSYSLHDQTVTLHAGEQFPSSVTFDAVGATTAGLYYANVTGTSGSNLANYDLISIEVVPAQGISLTPNPDTVTVGRGGASATSIITIKSSNVAHTINLSISCFPEEITASLAPGSVTLTSGQTLSAALTVTASQYTTPGDYSVTVYGEGITSLAHNQTVVTVVVTGPDFSLSTNPVSLSILQGSSQTSTISMTSIQGFTSNVVLSALPIGPSGLTAILSTTTISSSVTSTLTVQVTAATRVGSYMIFVTGTGGGRTHDLQIAVQVTGSSPQPDFQISATTPVSFTSSTTATSTITLSALNYFYSPVVLSATVAPSTGLTVSF